ncbi:MAG: MotA/TolQ/ExbB proton channel family protein [Bdellovibrionales bacterium]
MIEPIILAFQRGGFWMWAILVFQIISIVIIVDRFLFLYRRRKDNQKEYAEKFAESICKGELNSVIDQTKRDTTEHPIALAIQMGAQAAVDGGGREEIQGKMDEALIAETSLLDKRTSFLVMLGNVGTLTGLLGTIVGMIKAFSAVTYANPAEKATLLSSGVSEAMNTTAYGLVMAIPALFMFAVLQNRSNELQEDLTQGALKIFNLLSYKYQTVFEKKLEASR